MACLRNFSRRNLSPKWFCKSSSSPVVLHHIKGYTGPSLSDSSLLIRRFHRQVFFEDRTKMSFAQPVGSGVFLCRHISSSSCKPEEWCIKIDAFGDTVEELVPEKSLEAIATKVSIIDECSAATENLSLPEDCVQYVINGIHELTGFNWWMSIVITAFLVFGLMSPVSLRIQRQAWEIQILGRSIKKVKRVIQTCDARTQWEALAKYKKWEAEWMERYEERLLSVLTLGFVHVFITISFINGISAMAKKIPGFENGGIFWFTDLSTPDSFYILPLVTGLTFWLTSEALPINQTNLLSRMKKLPLFFIVFIAVQVTNEYEPAVYFYLIPFRIYIYIYIYTLFLMCRSKQRVKLRKTLGWPDVPVTASEQQRIIARVISLTREFIDVIKKQDKK